MHAFFDEQIFVDQEQGGISRYFTELARALGQEGVGTHLFAGFTRNLYVPALRQAPGVTVRCRARRDRLRINTWIGRVCRIWRRWEFARLRRQYSVLVYHATNYTVDPWIARRSKATCFTVFDMIGELLCDEPSRVRSLQAKQHAVALASVVLCISAQTKRDFLRFFPACPAAVAVTPLAASLSLASAGDLKRAANLAPYLLMVGKRHGYKNGITALRAFARIAQAHKNVRLICVGGEPWHKEELALLNEAGVADRAQLLRGGDSLLAACYTQASALLYPSRYEGFGLPVLEAMQLGCPVITTRCASLPEVAGEAALYLEPDDIPGWTTTAERVLRDEAFRRQWRLAGQVRCQQFKWQTTARLTKAAYENHLAQVTSDP